MKSSEAFKVLGASVVMAIVAGFFLALSSHGITPL
jgi:hypothetical protein